MTLPEAELPRMLHALKVAYATLSRPEIYTAHPVGAARTIILDALEEAGIADEVEPGDRPSPDPDAAPDFGKLCADHGLTAISLSGGHESGVTVFIHWQTEAGRDACTYAHGSTFAAAFRNALNAKAREA